VDAALDRLAADGALDEERMMAAYVAERAGKGFGPLRIRAELRERGLPDDRIETHLGSMADDWPARLADAHDRRFGSGRPSDGADYGRRGRFLEQRGFPTEMIRRFLR
jgi:regulatory protein